MCRPSGGGDTKGCLDNQAHCSDGENESRDLEGRVDYSPTNQTGDNGLDSDDDYHSGHASAAKWLLDDTVIGTCTPLKMMWFSMTVFLWSWFQHYTRSRQIIYLQAHFSRRLSSFAILRSFLLQLSYSF